MWIALVIAPFITWGVEELRMNYKVAAAIIAEKRTQVEICEGRVSKIGQVTSENAWRSLETIRTAEQSVSPTPQTKPELVALCKKDMTCRDRGKK